ncbi:hypothetical protein M426DRAFT_324615, partial [Hypoxylon sp. CI-4A]
MHQVVVGLQSLCSMSQVQSGAAAVGTIRAGTIRLSTNNKRAQRKSQVGYDHVTRQLMVLNFESLRSSSGLQ